MHILYVEVFRNLLAFRSPDISTYWYLKLLGSDGKEGVLEEIKIVVLNTAELKALEHILSGYHDYLNQSPRGRGSAQYTLLFGLCGQVKRMLASKKTDETQIPLMKRDVDTIQTAIETFLQETMHLIIPSPTRDQVHQHVEALHQKFLTLTSQQP